MTKYRLANGWTKETVMAQIKKYNKDRIAMHNRVCQYQAPDGNRCLLGCFIPDGHPALTTTTATSASHLTQLYPLLRDLFPFKDLNAIDAFQAVHDDIVFKDSAFEPLSVYDEAQKFLDDCVD